MNKVVQEERMIKELEQAESRYWSEYYTCIFSNLKNILGLTSNIINGAFAGALSNVDILAFNRTLGFGNDYEINEDHVHSLINFYEKAVVNRFFLPISPIAKFNSENQDLEKYGFRFHNNWVKFYKKLTAPIPSKNNGIKVESVNPRDSHIFDNIIQKGFEWQDDAALLFSQTIGRPGWKHYFAKIDNKPIAAASLYNNKNIASLAIAATLPEFRRNGAQSALITQRMNDALKSGCKYIIVETAEDKPDKPSASNRNIKRFGFKFAYLRPNYIYYFND